MSEEVGQIEAESDGVTQFLEKAKVYAAKVPDKFFPVSVKEKIKPGFAGVLSLGIGIFDDVFCMVFTNYFGAFLTILLTLAGIYIGVYALKYRELPQGRKDLIFACSGIALGIVNIFYILFVYIPAIKALGEAKNALKKIPSW